jgi:4-amino-4-deoxy-L-arabinose transferase-like glycosyltransferase
VESTVYPGPVPNTARWPTATATGLAIPRALARQLLLAAAIVVALAFRTYGLSTYGFSEDEINKVHAIQQYRTGDLVANAEHPMLMKLAMWGSVAAADGWNRITPAAEHLSLESAIRLPNAIAGAATTLVLFAVAQLLFGDVVALAASLFWAFDVNAIAINRLGKEDTFLLFFFLLAIWFYERAKREGVVDASRAQRWYAASGAAFGLMLASKYMPHYLGIYALFNTLTDRTPGENRPNRWRYYGAMAAAFLAANIVVLSPDTWRYCISYVQGGMLAHHGYLYAGQLYVTNIPISPLGVPVGYYFRLLATKVPLVVLAAAVPGLIELVRRRHERGFVLLRVLIVFLLVPYSLMAAKFIRYTLPMLATLDLLAAVGIVAGIGWLLRKGWLCRVTRVSVATLAIAVSIVGLVAAPLSTAPYYSLFQNGIGARHAAATATFPEQNYDVGVREAIAAIAAVAEPSAVVVTDAAAVAAHYLDGIGRSDLSVRTLSGEGIPYGPHEVWVIAQDEHTTFENQLVVEQLRQRQAPWREFRVADARAAQLFRIGGR